MVSSRQLGDRFTSFVIHSTCIKDDVGERLCPLNYFPKLADHIRTGNHYANIGQKKSNKLVKKGGGESIIHIPY